MTTLEYTLIAFGLAAAVLFFAWRSAQALSESVARDAAQRDDDPDEAAPPTVSDAIATVHRLGVRLDADPFGGLPCDVEPKED